MNKRNILMAYAMMAMGSGMGMYDDRYDKVDLSSKRDGPKKCFRDGCDKKRNGNKLYCSSGCCKTDKIERKKLT